MLPEDVLFGEQLLMGMNIVRSKKNEPREMLSPEEELTPPVLPYKMLLLLGCLVQLGAINKAEQNTPH